MTGSGNGKLRKELLSVSLPAPPSGQEELQCSGADEKGTVMLPNSPCSSQLRLHMQGRAKMLEKPLRPGRLDGCSASSGRKWLPFKELERFLAGVAAKHPKRWVALAERPGAAQARTLEMPSFVSLRFSRISKRKEREGYEEAIKDT